MIKQSVVDVTNLSAESLAGLVGLQVAFTSDGNTVGPVQIEAARLETLGVKTNPARLSLLVRRIWRRVDETEPLFVVTGGDEFDSDAVRREDVRPPGQDKWRAPHQMRPGDWLVYEASTIEEVSCPPLEGKRDIRLRSGRTVTKREGQLCRVVRPEA